MGVSVVIAAMMGPDGAMGLHQIAQHATESLIQVLGHQVAADVQHEIVLASFLGIPSQSWYIFVCIQIHQHNSCHMTSFCGLPPCGLAVGERAYAEWLFSPQASSFKKAYFLCVRSLEALEVWPDRPGTSC